MTDLSLFRYSRPIEVRFADLDALNHVNHAKYFTYMETARIHYCRDVLGWDGQSGVMGVIIAQATCQYKLPLLFGDEATCHIRASRIGGKSFDLEYLLLRADGVTVAEASTVQVAFDYTQQSSIPVPDAWRAAMRAYEPALTSPDETRP
jgi:acyl-CoA thioester hydrolase